MLKITERKIGEFRVFQLAGEFIVSTLVDIRNQISQAMDAGQNYLAFDMSQLSHIDSSAMGLLQNVSKKVDTVNGHLVLFSVPPHILSSLEQTGLAESFTMVRDEEDFKNNFII